MTALAFAPLPAVGRRPYTPDVQAVLDQFADDVNLAFSNLPVVAGAPLIANQLGDVGWDYAAMRGFLGVFSTAESDAQYVALGQIDVDGTLAANSDIKLASQKAVKTYVDAATVGVNPFDTSGAVPLVRSPPSTRMGLPLRAFRLAVGDRANTLVSEAVIGDSLAELWTSDPENLTWLAVYEAAVAGQLNPLPRTAGYVFVDQPAGFPFPRGIHWDTVAGTQTSVAQPAFVGTGTISTATNHFVLTAHGYADNTPIRFTGLTGATGGVSNNTIYYVRDTAANSFNVAATVGGAAITLTGAGDATVAAMSVGAPWGRSLVSGQVCELTRIGDGVTIFYTAQHARGDSAEIRINGTLVGTVNSTDASVATTPGSDSGRSVSYANPAGYGSMDITVTNTSGSGTFILDACYISAGNLASGYRLDRVSHGGWGMTEFLDAARSATLEHIKNQLPQLVTIHLGANDYFHHAVTSTQFGTLLTNLVAAVRAQYGANPLPSIRFIFEPKIDPGSITATDWETTYRAIARTVCQADGDLGFIDWYEILGTYGSGAGNDVYAIAPNDEVHPSDKGHYAMAQAVIEATVVGGGGSGGSGGGAVSALGNVTVTDGVAAHGRVAVTVGTILGQPSAALAIFNNSGDTKAAVFLGVLAGSASLQLGPGGSTGGTDVKLTRTGTSAATFLGTITLPSPILTGTPSATDGTFSVVDGTAGHGAAKLVANVLGQAVQLLGNTGDTVAKATLLPDGVALGAGGSTAADVSFRRTGVGTATIIGTVTIPAAILTGTTQVNSELDVVDGTAGHGLVTVNVGGLGPFVNLYGNSTDSVSKINIGSTGIRFGPGGAGALDASLLRTGTAALALVGVLTVASPPILTGLTGVIVGNGASAVTAVTAPAGAIVGTTDTQVLSAKTLTSPVLNTGVSGTAVDTDSAFAANSDTLLPSQKAVATAVALKSPLASPSFTGSPGAIGGSFAVTDGTGAHGQITTQVNAFGPAFLLLGAVGDTKAKVQVDPTNGIAFGPGGSSAFDVGFRRTGTATATITGTTTLAAPILTGTAVAATIAATGAITSSGTGGVGYATGAGGTVTQATSKATAVTLNKTTGQITMNAAALLTVTAVAFTFTNSTIAATDTVVVAIASGATSGAYVVTVEAVAAGSCKIQLRNNSVGSLSEAVVLNYTVVKGVSS